MNIKLLDVCDVSQIPEIGSTKFSTDPIAYVKLFLPGSSWSWYIIEYDGKDICFGYVRGDFDELGYFSLSELKSVRGKLGLGVELDRSFNPTRLSVIKKHPYL